MAYMSQEKKAQLAPGIKAILKEYGVKGTISVRNRMVLVVTIREGSIDFMGNYHKKMREDWGTDDDTPPPPIVSIAVNTHWYNDNFSDIPAEFLEKLIHAMNVGNHDRSDIMTDYFDVGWYIDINIGTWEKPYKYIP